MVLIDHKAESRSFHIFYRLPLLISRHRLTHNVDVQAITDPILNETAYREDESEYEKRCRVNTENRILFRTNKKGKNHLGANEHQYYLGRTELYELADLSPVRRHIKASRYVRIQPFGIASQMTLSDGVANEVQEMVNRISMQNVPGVADQNCHDCKQQHMIGLADIQLTKPRWM